jgi:hypothetical protein
MSQFSFRSRQAPANLPQRLGVPQLAKEHGHELAPTSKAPRMPFGVVPAGGPFKFQTWNQLQDL